MKRRLVSLHLVLCVENEPAFGTGVGKSAGKVDGLHMILDVVLPSMRKLFAKCAKVPVQGGIFGHKLQKVFKSGHF